MQSRDNRSIVFLFITAVMIFVASPLIGRVLYSMTKNNLEPKATNQSIELAINNELGDKATQVNSYRVVNDWWYVVNTTDTPSGKSSLAVVADFKNGSGPRLVIAPGEIFTQKNISGVGVPYEVINEVSKTNGSKNDKL